MSSKKIQIKYWGVQGRELVPVDLWEILVVNNIEFEMSVEGYIFRSERQKLIILSLNDKCV